MSGVDACYCRIAIELHSITPHGFLQGLYSRACFINSVNNFMILRHLETGCADITFRKAISAIIASVHEPEFAETATAIYHESCINL